MLSNSMRPLFLFSRLIVATLCVLICLVSVTKVQAQKKPPILSDDKISAFDRQRIIALEDIAKGTDDAARLARNKLIAIAVEQVDTAFNDYRKKSRKRSDILSFIFDVLEIGASTAISIVGGTRSKTLVGEGLSFFQGSRSAFNKDFRFLERQLLFDKMVAKRSQKLTDIYKKLDVDINTYPWEQARSELRAYFFAGTIDEALSSLSRETGAEATEAVKQLAKVTPGQFERSVTYTKRVAELFKAAKTGTPEAASAAITKLKAAMKSNLDLTPAGTTGAAIDSMTVTQVEQLYRSAAAVLTQHPDKLGKLVDALN